MRSVNGLLKAAVVLVVIALASMLVCLTWLTPCTLVLFMGVGLVCGAAGVVLFLAHVLADLRARGAL